MKKLNLILFVIPLAFFSCSETLDDVTSAGKFNSTISGSISKAFDGEAAFVHSILVSNTPQGSTLNIVLSNATDQSEIITLTVSELDNTNGIVSGTYSYGVIGGAGALFIPTYTINQVLYSPDQRLTNKIIISSVADLRVKGEFEINLIDVTSSDVVAIVGTFDAVGNTTTN